jgi:beta-N-acetylhexosaminidase
LVVQAQPNDDVGQLFMFGFEGESAADVPRDLAAQCAGAVLFRRNINHVNQVYALTEELRRCASASGVDPLIAVDQEGGTVSRLAAIGTTTPSAMALAAVNDPSAISSMYEIIGTELAALGIDTDLAPVADVTTAGNTAIGIRSFGDDPALVGARVRAAIDGLRRCSLAATAKHFPGYGRAQLDPHALLPTIDCDLDRWRQTDMVPFADAIQGGVDLIMTAHVVCPGLDDSRAPATMSHRILTRILREELQYDGVILTDCMEMEAVAAGASPADTALAAIAAGADLVLFSHSPDKVRSAMASVRAAVADGRLAPQRIAASVRRVRRLRGRLTASRRRPKLDVVGSSEHREAALDAARRAVTVVRDPRKLVPLDLARGQRLMVVEFAGGAAGVEDAEKHRRTALGPFLEESPARLHEQVRALDVAGHEYKQLLMAATAADAVIVLTTRAAQHPLQAQAVSDLVMLGKKVIAVALREPYDAGVLPEQLAVIACYGDDANAMHAAADVIMGRVAARGTLPVTLAPGRSAVP